MIARTSELSEVEGVLNVTCVSEFPRANTGIATPRNCYANTSPGSAAQARAFLSFDNPCDKPESQVVMAPFDLGKGLTT